MKNVDHKMVNLAVRYGFWEFVMISISGSASSELFLLCPFPFDFRLIFSVLVRHIIWSFNET